MISATTTIAAVVGDPVDHSMSPAVHNAAFAAAGLDWAYGAFRVPAGGGASAVEAMRSLGLGGLSVTMPLKDEVAQAVDRLTPGARALGAVNCVFRDGDELVGDNTDGDGFLWSLRRELGFEPDGRQVAVLGAGGAARAIVEALGRAGARVTVHNRSADRAAEAARVHERAAVGGDDALAEAALLVNATSVGMEGGPAPDDLPLAPALLRPDLAVADIVYRPRVTPLLAAAAAIGAPTLGGLGMLVGQAAAQFEHWTGVPAPIEVMATTVEPSPPADG